MTTHPTQGIMILDQIINSIDMHEVELKTQTTNSAISHTTRMGPDIIKQLIFTMPQTKLTTMISQGTRKIPIKIDKILVERSLPQ